MPFTDDEQLVEKIARAFCNDDFDAWLNDAGDLNFESWVETHWQNYTKDAEIALRAIAPYLIARGMRMAMQMAQWKTPSEIEARAEQLEKGQP